MRRVERALLHKLPAMCAPTHPGSEEPVLRVTGLAARDHRVLFLVAEPVG
jgi:hypothetical protein